MALRGAVDALAESLSTATLFRSVQRVRLLANKLTEILEMQTGKSILLQYSPNCNVVYLMLLRMSITKKVPIPVRKLLAEFPKYSKVDKIPA